MNFSYQDVKINTVIGLVLGLLVWLLGIWQNIEVLSWWVALIVGQGLAWIFYFVFINDRKVK